MSSNNTDLFPPNYSNCDEVDDRCAIEFTVYGTELSGPAAVFFAIVYILLLLAQLYFGFRGRMWSFTIWLGLGSLLEILGYLGRFALSRNPWELNAFIVQYVCLLLAPTLVAAAISVTFKHLVIWYGSRWSLLRPRLYPWVFVGTDFISIFIQVIGGGVSAQNAAGEGNETTQTLAEALIIGGVAFQVANMLCCAALMLVYARRRRSEIGKGFMSIDSQANLTPGTYGAPPRGPVPTSRSEATLEEAKRVRWFIYGLGLAYTLIIIRCIYRIAETIPEISLEVMRNEPLFLVFDGAMIFIAVLTVTVLHPQRCFPFLGLKARDRPSNSPSEVEMQGRARQ
ncbi:RTA1 like protein-domain-containing protein [Stachybotrys elegans]|uniref:RTA1 like protein-domain-containing protein n=1 Tax=Stachybotrys elegans TaxID=80388 RepID=A0A8K0SJS9_9HYPO|nr:RTA1 like protein-domain-containing protein [Stachybotrys elegans]